MALHDKIAQISLECFENLPKMGKPNVEEWTVLSCIVKENSAISKFEVVALGTGSKCIGKTKMSAIGDIINDSHGEVICRRSFLRYLYYEIELCLSSRSEIFELDSVAKKFVLKTHIFFHFFTTQVPCGDAAIFPKIKCDDIGRCLLETNHSATSSNQSLKRCLESDQDIGKRMKLDSSEESRDIFRTGAKCLPADVVKDPLRDGPNYHTVGAIRTKPGRGDATLSVSCSDKLAKWSYLGIQGALLSILLNKPIYLKTFTITGNTPFCETALERALWRRFNNAALDYPYVQHKMIWGQATKAFEFNKCELKRPCPSSIVWNKDYVHAPEVAVEGKKQGTTKKKMNLPSSRMKICKAELFKRFAKIVKLCKLTSLEDTFNMQYKDVKFLGKDYHKAWLTLRQNVFKIWTVKDQKLLEFFIDK